MDTINRNDQSDRGPGFLNPEAYCTRCWNVQVANGDNNQCLRATQEDLK